MLMCQLRKISARGGASGLLDHNIDLTILFCSVSNLKEHIPGNSFFVL
jgi:hypothetical protein